MQGMLQSVQVSILMKDVLSRDNNLVLSRLYATWFELDIVLSIQICVWCISAVVLVFAVVCVWKACTHGFCPEQSRHQSTSLPSPCTTKQHIYFFLNSWPSLSPHILTLNRTVCPVPPWYVNIISWKLLALAIGSK